MLTSLACATTGERTGREQEGYRLLNTVKPTLVRNISYGRRMRIWVLVDEAGVFRTRVCMDYKETGSHVWRNSCRKNAPANLRVARFNRAGQPDILDTPLSNAALERDDSAALEQKLNRVLNAEVKIIDLDEVTLEPIDPPGP